MKYSVGGLNCLPSLQVIIQHHLYFFVFFSIGVANQQMHIETIALCSVDLISSLQWQNQAEPKFVSWLDLVKKKSQEEWYLPTHSPLSCLFLEEYFYS